MATIASVETAIEHSKENYNRAVRMTSRRLDAAIKATDLRVVNSLRLIDEFGAAFRSLLWDSSVRATFLSNHGLLSAEAHRVAAPVLDEGFFQALRQNRRSINDLVRTLGSVQLASDTVRAFGRSLDSLAHANTTLSTWAVRLDAIEVRLAAFNRSFERLARSQGPFAHGTKVLGMPLPVSSREVIWANESLDFLRRTEHETADDFVAGELAEYVVPESECEELLASVDPALVTLLRGAKSALQARGPDCARHVLTSLRELTRHLFRKLAPSDQLRTWLRQGERISRATAIRFVCRAIDHPPLVNFVELDVRCLEGLRGLANRLHEVEPGLTPAQLWALVHRTESFAVYLIRVSQLID